MTYAERSMRCAVLVSLLLSGCALTEDWDRYSQQHDAVAIETAVVEGDTASEDTGNVEPVDSATVDSAVADTSAPPVDDGPCAAGKILCGATCVDPMSDREHCGGCTSCEAQGFKGASQCVAGSCGCRSGATPCAGTCAYTDSDPLNCGGCGKQVEDSSRACVSGAPACAPGLRPCDDWDFPWEGSTIYVACPTSSVCVDTSAHGNLCFKYSGSTITYRQRCYRSGEIGVCKSNACDFRIGESGSPCNGPGEKECAVVTAPTDPSGRVRSCAKTLTDPNHCGGCNIKCSKGELCAAGACKRYRAAKSAADCGAGSLYCTPPGWSLATCIEGVAACP